MSIYYDQTLMTRGRVDSYRYDRVDELDSEDPSRIYSHPQHHRIVLATSTHQSHPAGNTEFISGQKSRHCPSIQIARIPIDEILVGRLASCVWKVMTISLSMTSGDH